MPEYLTLGYHPYSETIFHGKNGDGDNIEEKEMEEINRLNELYGFKEYNGDVETDDKERALVKIMYLLLSAVYEVLCPSVT